MGAQTGVKIAVAVAAMVLAFVALVALANGLLGAVGSWFGYPDLSFQMILGTLLSPLMYLLNIPANETATAGALLGTKVVLNEFVAGSEIALLLYLPAELPLFLKGEEFEAAHLAVITGKRVELELRKFVFSHFKIDAHDISLVELLWPAFVGV